MTVQVEIDDDDLLYRRVIGYFIVADSRIGSAAFKDRRGKPDPSISVDLARLTTPEACLAGAPNASFRLAGIVAGDARTIGFDVVHDPLPENDAHALILGDNTPAKCRQLANHAVLIA